MAESSLKPEKDAILSESININGKGACDMSYEKLGKANLLSNLAAAVFVGAFVLIDQYTKFLAVSHLKGQKPIILIDRVFQLCYLENRGAAFGLFQNQRTVFLINTVIILAVMIYFYGKFPHNKRFFPLRVCVVFICAGAVGNMIDRFRLGYVVDFLYFNLIDFPVFNVADIYVTCSVFILAALILWYYKEDDFEQILHRGNRRGDAH